ncbi:MAG: zinc ribbon domain-containing protein [Planctomycetota bacterium]|nr:MAG: zinc ribbon domain-containing protein [Planctomycetota bacterium]REJ92880.1 MAG: zinc ribbon domain-containing protein [Planctomycetota bacterium]REK27907.1 MAG: zinc ribbon domain-containing protein [Planctomycetota bacterium]REK40346.1 MAG: zinc ribbon domain-containing protein [Planctomycetota bacterium]
MPLYEYHCDDCQQDIEVLVRGEAEPKCDDCGSSRLTRLLSVPATPATKSGGSLPQLPPCGMGGCGRPECE